MPSCGEDTRNTCLEAERLVGPCQLEKPENLFEGLAIDPVGFALVADGRGHVNLLRHLVEPAGLVTAREATNVRPLVN